MLSWKQFWTEAHQDAGRRSFIMLRQQPWSTVMTVVMIAVTLMLAVLCWLTTYNLAEFNSNWQRNETFNVYLNQELNDANQHVCFQNILAMPEVESAILTTPAEGLALLAKQEGMHDIAQSLPNNPLPAVIQIIPSSRLQTPVAIEQFVLKLKNIPDVVDVAFDSDWLQRLYLGLGFLKKLGALLTVLFALSVILVIVNTLRILIYNRRNDIEVLQLIGAPQRFILRPFLFASIGYGFCAAILAIILADFVLMMLRLGMHDWAASYHIQLSISLLSLPWILGLIGFSVGLSWTGARLTLKYYL